MLARLSEKMVKREGMDDSGKVGAEGVVGGVREMCA
jgi:hypothetical protein